MLKHMALQNTPGWSLLHNRESEIKNDEKKIWIFTHIINPLC